MLGVGVLFALSFDTLSQAALMAATGAASQGLAAVALLAGAFVLGMIMADGLNGWWVAHLVQRPGAGSARASRVMCVAISGISLGTAALVRRPSCRRRRRLGRGPLGVVARPSSASSGRASWRGWRWRGGNRR